MQRQNKILIIRKGRVLGSAVGCGVVLATLAFYFTRLSPASPPVGANQFASSNERREGPSSVGHRVTERSSRTSTASQRLNESSDGQEKAFYDFSGIRTIDPNSPSSTIMPRNSPEPKEEPKEALPVVFQPVDPKLLKLTPEQQKIVDQLKQSFLDRMGSAPQDPNDPKYLEQWEEAQPQIDQQLKAQLGQDFFIRYEMATTTQTKR